MSALDLFIGSEGTLGVLTEIEIELILKPQEYFSGIVLFNQEEHAWQFARHAREESLKNRICNAKDRIDASGLEYFDSQSLEILRSIYTQIPPKARSAIFFEQEIRHESKKKLIEQWFQLCKVHQSLIEQNWFGQSPKEHNEFRLFSHAIPVLVNKILRQYNQTKIGTDFSVPQEHFFDLLNLYRQLLGDFGLQYCIFGHIADNHLDVNLLPQNNQEAEKGWKLYHQIVKQIIDWEGSVSAEHGVGKIKRDYLLDMYGIAGLKEMAQIKKKLDPCEILGRGNIIPEEYP